MSIITLGIQSDWNQATTTALDFIKNKPNAIIYRGDLPIPVSATYTFGELETLDTGYYFVNYEGLSLLNLPIDRGYMLGYLYIKRNGGYNFANYVDAFGAFAAVSAPTPLPTPELVVTQDDWADTRTLPVDFAKDYETGGNIETSLQSKESKAINETKTATSTGTIGESAYDDNYLYKCIATNTWIRFAKTEWV